MHIGMGLICGSKIKDMLDAGFDFTVFLADWHSWINNKLGGNMDNIRLCGEYFKHCFEGLGIESQRVNYVWASELARDISYWEKVVRIGKSASIQRVWRALPIMGRSMDTSDMESASILYPCMQAADIFQLKLDVACAGIDQRKAHMLARDSADKLGMKKPTCVHTHLLMALSEPEPKTEGQFDENIEMDREIRSKMSKSIPGKCVFVHDTPEEIKKKIGNAFCPPKDVKSNPMLEMAKYAIFPMANKLELDRPAKYGGPLTFENYETLEVAYSKGEIHPLDMKNSIADALTTILKGVREHFTRHPDPLKRMMEIEITR
jgi:tyrosyl-tRNA synthetase